MPTYTKTAELAYEDSSYGWTTGEASQGDCSPWGGGTRRWGILYFPGLSALRGKKIGRVLLRFTPEGGYGSPKIMRFFRSKVSGIDTSLSAPGDYKAASLGTLTELVSGTEYQRDVTGLLGGQIASPEAGTSGDTLMIYSDEVSEYLKLYSATLTVEYITTSPCTPPTSLGGAPSLYEGEITLHWAGAAGGTDNPIRGYLLQSRTGKDKGTWSPWSTVATVSGTSHRFAPAAQRGDWLSLRIKTLGAAGTAFDSGFFTAPAFFRKNQVPAPPANLVPSKTTFNGGESLTLTWTPSVDPDGNEKEYLLEYFGAGAWEAAARTTGLSASHVPQKTPEGGTCRYRVSAIDALNVQSGYRVSGEILREDYTGIKVSLGGAYRKAKIFVSDGKIWQNAKIQVFRDGKYQNPTD